MRRLNLPLLTTVFVLLLQSATQANPAMWAESQPAADTYAAFRGRFTLDRPTRLELRHVGSSWYVIWVDGKLVAEGPARFVPGRPEYMADSLELPAGAHVLAVQAHHIGETTRLLMNMPPFVWVEALAEGRPLAVNWKCSRLPGYAPRVRRINPQLGWIEWCDTRGHPANWQQPGFEDQAWAAPVPAGLKVDAPPPAKLAPVGIIVEPAKAIAEGRLADGFGYELDDIPARFFLRELEPSNPPQGLWRRYDLGRVRLARPRFVLDLPAGAVVEFAYSENLQHGRVSPWVTLSAGPSCNLDHHVARGGEQEFFPLTPKGGRFVEVHVLAPPEKVRFVREEFIERCYHGPSQGSFRSGDALLDRIWQVGVETFRGCSEDALIDNPTRERGQWTGDVVSVGMDINAAAYSDLRLCRRGLVQSALSAREDGLIAGLCPGGPAFLPTYSAQWVDACLRYYELTGDKALLEELYPAAVRNVGAFEKFITADGLGDGLGWVFVDWGYVRNEGPVDIGFNLHLLTGLRAMCRWCAIVGRKADEARYRTLEEQIATTVRRWLDGRLVQGDWTKVGYHRAVLALRAGLVRPEQTTGCVEYIKRHMLNCFPNDPTAPRLADPAAANPRLITPYFAHYAMPALIEHGEMDFVLGQYRTCWGWALGDGRTTWVEVFDTRWTHCHQWAGCPTWQLSRYGLGLHPRFDLGANTFVLKLRPGSLPSASGAIPLPGGEGLVKVQWSRTGDGVRWTAESPVPIRVLPRPDASDVQPATRVNLALSAAELE